jgi:hypothetical protein
MRRQRRYDLRNLPPMDAFTKLQLLFGPVRPFILGKLVDALAVPVAAARAKRLVPIAVLPRTLLPAVPLPSAAWLDKHAHQVLRFSASWLDGHVGAYGIETWYVGDADPQVEDIRSIHELSRMHPWCAMALCASVDPANGARWSNAVVESMLTFIDAYPPHHGTHWLFPMGIAIRSLSMVTAIGWLQLSGIAIAAAAEHRIAASLLDHGILLRARREHSGGMTTSHFLANMTGLLAIGAAVQDPVATPWFAHGQAALDHELHRQILDDGFGNEASTGYHRQIVDLFLAAATIINHRQGALPNRWRDRLSKAVAVQQALDSVGMPLIGDNDDGMAYKLTGFAPDTSFLHAMAAQLRCAVPSPNLHCAMPAAGLDVYRNNSYDIVLRAGGIGQYGKGGHAHNDQSGLVLRIDGTPIIVDPGSSTYTGNPAVRNAERSAAMHSVMMVENQEQNVIPRDTGEGLFWLLGDRCRARVEHRDDTTWQACLQHPNVRRSVTMMPREIAVVDTHVSGDAALLLTLPVAHGLACTIANDTLEIHDAGRVLCRIVFSAFSRNNQRCPLSWDVVDGHASPQFGVRESITIVRVKAQACRIEWRVDVCSH